MEIRIRSSTPSYLTPPHPFHLDYTLTCGQIFGWKKIFFGYAGIIAGRPFFLKNQENLLTVTGDSGWGQGEIGKFFRWEDPLEEIAVRLSGDAPLSRAFSRYAGLRIIRQDPWSCLVGFILSMFSSIKKIELTLDKISRRAGNSIKFEGEPVPVIPPPETLASMRERTLRGLGMGFRAPYLRACAKRIAGGFPLEALRRLPYPDAKAAIMELPGVGEKVADCILLFSLDHMEAFPVDVWMQRIVSRYYFGGKEKTTRYISEWGRERFGPLAGYAQQYLYMMGRSEKIS